MKPAEPSKRRRRTMTRNDNSEYIAEGITPNYVDRNGLPKSFKVVWVTAVIILLLIGAWLIYNNEGSSGYTGGGRYSVGTGKPRNITGYGVLFIAILMGLFFVLLVWPRKRKAKEF